MKKIAPKTLGTRSRLISGERMRAAEASAIEQNLSSEIIDALRGHSKFYDDVEVLRLLADIDRRFTTSLEDMEELNQKAYDEGEEEGISKGKLEGAQDLVDDYVSPLVEEVEMLIDRLSALKLLPEELGEHISNTEGQLKRIGGKFRL